MEGKHDGQGNETDKEVQQARPTDADRGIVDGILGDCDSDVLAVKPAGIRAGQAADEAENSLTKRTQE
jgi:hypothetical protein